MIIPQLNKFNFNFPPATSANEEGIVAWGGDLHPTRIIRAYQQGIFPWYSEQDPILWWSPDPRLIMELNDFKCSKSLKKSMKKFTYTFDTRFNDVIHNCAHTPRKNQYGTWLNHDMIEAYTELFNMGIAHSVEAYYNGELVGGLYGIAIGKIFCGESMFAHKSDASKAAYATLVDHLQKWGYHFIDCQVPTNHLKSLGAKEISRDEYLNRVQQSGFETLETKWEINS